MPRHPSCASASASPTTAPTSAGGAGSRACAPCRACSRRRSARCSGERGEAPRLTVAGRTDAGRARARPGRAPRRRRGRARGGRAPAPRSRRTTRRPRRRSPGGSPASSGADADVVVTHAERAPAGFDARFSAIWRRYEYRVADASAARDPLERRRTLVVPRALDAEAMDAAARVARAACTTSPRSAGRARARRPSARCRPTDGRATTTACSSRRSRPTRSATRWCARSSAPCVAVGEGRLEAADPARAAAGRRERTSAFTVMPAKGLVLTEVGYPDDHELEARAGADPRTSRIARRGHRRLSFPFGAAACAGTRR